MNEAMSTADRVGDAMRQFAQWCERTNAFAAKQLGLNPTDMACIDFIHASLTPVSAKQLISYVGLTSGSGTALIDRLEKAGLVVRVPNPDDRRSVLIQLDAIAAAPIGFYRSLATTLSGVIRQRSPEEMEMVIAFLEDVAKSQVDALMEHDVATAINTPAKANGVRS